MQLFKTLSLVLALVAGTSASLSAHQPVVDAQITSPMAEAADIVSGRVLGQHKVTWDMTLVAGQLAILQLRGDGVTNLDLYLYDENGNLIDFDEGLSDRAVVSVTPRWTGKFYAVIVNRGYVYNDYTLRLI